MIDSHVPPHHVCNSGSHVSGNGDVRAGAVADGGANRSVISLPSASACELDVPRCTHWYIDFPFHSSAVAALTTLPSNTVLAARSEIADFILPEFTVSGNIKRCMRRVRMSSRSAIRAYHHFGGERM